MLMCVVSGTTIGVWASQGVPKGSGCAQDVPLQLANWLCSIDLSTPGKLAIGCLLYCVTYKACYCFSYKTTSDWLFASIIKPLIGLFLSSLIGSLHQL